MHCRMRSRRCHPLGQRPSGALGAHGLQPFDAGFLGQPGLFGGFDGVDDGFAVGVGADAPAETREAPGSAEYPVPAGRGVETCDFGGAIQETLATPWRPLPPPDCEHPMRRARSPFALVNALLAGPAAISLAAGAVPAAQAAETISGTVKWKDGTPAAGVEVTYAPGTCETWHDYVGGRYCEGWSYDGAIPASVTTSAAGAFSFSVLLALIVLLPDPGREPRIPALDAGQVGPDRDEPADGLLGADSHGAWLLICSRHPTTGRLVTIRCAASPDSSHRCGEQAR